MDELTWDEARHRWLGHAAVEGVGRVGVAVDPGEVEPDLALEYARFTFAKLLGRLDAARQHAARRLLDDFNDFNAHLKDGEPLTPEAFAGRLRLEGLRFAGEGAACLDFAHDLYRGDQLFEGGLIVVECSAEGRFRKAYWVTDADAEDLRQLRTDG